MNTQAQPTEFFAPVYIGRSPAGVEWYARKPEQVATMRKRLAALCAKSGKGFIY
jgi:hypothetical protein